MEKNVNTYGDLFFDVAETFTKVGEPAKAALVRVAPSQHSRTRMRSLLFSSLTSSSHQQVFERLIQNSAYNIPSIWQMQAESYRASGNASSAINTYLQGTIAERPVGTAALALVCRTNAPTPVSCA
jgi:hypothetical protein